MNAEYEFIIAGGGPAGLSTWLHLQQANPELAAHCLLLEKESYPREKLCGGGVTRQGEQILAELGIGCPVDFMPVHAVEFRYRGISWYWRQRNLFKVVQRSQFDAALARTAQQRGLNLHEGERLQSISPGDNGSLVIETNKAAYSCQALVGADGANSRVRMYLRMREPQHVARLIKIKPAALLPAPLRKDGLAVMEFDGLSRNLQGYTWNFPGGWDGQRVANYGIFDSPLFCSRPQADLKDIFSASLRHWSAGAGPETWAGHPLRAYYPGAVYSRPRFLLVGDAAGADAFAGEGISFALHYGKLAAQELIDAYSRQDYTFSGYSRRIHTKIGRAHV
jgi:menaquinone-9 beta-reductase